MLNESYPMAQLCPMGGQFSGYGCQTAIWIRKLAGMGHEVAVSSYWGLNGSATEWDGITILPGFGGNYCSPSLAEHARHFDPDLVITLGDIWVLDPGLLRGLPLAHWLPSDCRPMSTPDVNCARSSGAELIAMSRFGYDRFREAGFSPLYVPHGIDTGVFSPMADDDRKKIREAFGWTGKYVIGVNAANNDAIRKAIPEMMLAFARFAREHPDARLALHSGVHTEGGQDLEAVAENIGITDLVSVVDQYRYSAGLISGPDMAVWYNGLDVLAECTFGEGFGLPVIEAQACGVPVITTDASAMTELNPHGTKVPGQPFWNGVHRAWWIRPDITAILKAYEDAYAAAGKLDRKPLRDFALQYDKELVAREFMEPAVDELLARMDARRGV
jgi:glycosyltransferase involved in cell wall biosynthesis